MQEPRLPGWKCPQCGYDNEADVVTCVACEFPRPDSESYADLPFDEPEVEQ